MRDAQACLLIATSRQLSPPITVGITFDNSTAVEVSADRQTAARARQIRLSATACGCGNALTGSAIVGSTRRAFARGPTYRMSRGHPIGLNLRLARLTLRRLGTRQIGARMSLLTPNRGGQGQVNKALTATLVWAISSALSGDAIAQRQGFAFPIPPEATGEFGRQLVEATRRQGAARVRSTILHWPDVTGALAVDAEAPPGGPDGA